MSQHWHVWGTGVIPYGEVKWSWYRMLGDLILNVILAVLTLQVYILMWHCIMLRVHYVNRSVCWKATFSESRPHDVYVRVRSERRHVSCVNAQAQQAVMRVRPFPRWNWPRAPSQLRRARDLRLGEVAAVYVGWVYRRQAAAAQLRLWYQRRRQLVVVWTCQRLDRRQLSVRQDSRPSVYSTALALNQWNVFCAAPAHISIKRVSVALFCVWIVASSCCVAPILL